MASVPKYMYATQGNSLYVNLYVGSESRVALAERYGHIGSGYGISLGWTGQIDCFTAKGFFFQFETSYSFLDG